MFDSGWFCKWLFVGFLRYFQSEGVISQIEDIISQVEVIINKHRMLFRNMKGCYLQGGSIGNLTCSFIK